MAKYYKEKAFKADDVAEKTETKDKFFIPRHNIKLL